MAIPGQQQEVAPPTIARYDSADNLVSKHEVIVSNAPTATPPTMTMRLDQVHPLAVQGSIAIGEKQFGMATQDLIDETRYTWPYAGGSMHNTRRLAGYTAMDYQSVTSSTAYNFMGNPLTKTISEYTDPASGFSSPGDFSTTVEYAYWGADKYVQQKPVTQEGGSVAASLAVNGKSYVPRPIQPAASRASRKTRMPGGRFWRISSP